MFDFKNWVSKFRPKCKIENPIKDLILDNKDLLSEVKKLTEEICELKHQERIEKLNSDLMDMAERFHEQRRRAEAAEQRYNNFLEHSCSISMTPDSLNCTKRFVIEVPDMFTAERAVEALSLKLRLEYLKREEFGKR